MVPISRRSFLRAGTGALAVGFSGCSALDSNASESTNQGTVSSYKYDTARTGVGNTPLPGSNATEQWGTDPDVQSAIFMSWAAVDQQRVYADMLTFGQFPGPVVALNRETGTVEWRDDTNCSVPALAGDTLYVADERVRALATSDGSERWVTPPESDGGFAAPAVVDDTVYATTGETVCAFDTADGSTRWTVDRGRKFGAPVAVTDGTVYAAHTGDPDADNNEIIALDAVDGTERWQRPIPDSIGSSPAVTDDVVLVTDYKDTIYAIDRDDGTERWRQTLDGEPSSPTVADGRAYVRAGAEIVALAVTDGSVDWQRSASHAERGLVYPITLAEDALVVPAGKALAIHDPLDGAKQYELSVSDDHLLSGATVVNETIYVGGLVSNESGSEFGIYALGD